jgi:kynurenine formamidase
MWLLCIVSLVFSLSCTTLTGKNRLQRTKADLWPICAQLRAHSFVDLTHPFSTSTPHWKGFEPMKVKDLYTIAKDGFWVEEFTHVGQWGTHVDPPAHFHEGLRTVDQIPPVEMLLPLVVIDLHEKVTKNTDYILSVQDVLEWEARHGRIPQGAFVAMRTDWSKRWPDDEAMQNRDEKGVAHYPGWSLDALKFLYEERRITASGHEPTDTDPGISTSGGNYECESYVLKQNHYQIELMTNLDKVPERGAILFCSFPKPLNGSGFPARLFAIVP